MNKEEILGYLDISKNNPKFINDFDYVTHSLIQLERNGQISHEEYLKIYDQLYNKKLNTKKDPIIGSFVWFDDIVKNGYDSLKFTSEQLRVLVVTREVSAKFYNWANIKRHEPNNPLVMQYFKDLALELTNVWKTEDERKWDLYRELKFSAVSAVARGVVSRYSLDTISKILLLTMQDELKVIKSLKNRDLRKMNFFQKEYDEQLMDLDTINVEMTYLYLTDVDKFHELFKKYFKQLDDLYRFNKISQDEFRMYMSKLRECTYDYVETSKVEAYIPIQDYYTNIKNPDKSTALLYNQDQILTARDLARDFFKTVRNELLVRDMVANILRVDLSLYGYERDACRNFYKLLEDNLDLLLKAGIVTLDQRDHYLLEGRKKFL